VNEETKFRVAAAHRLEPFCPDVVPDEEQVIVETTGIEVELKCCEYCGRLFIRDKFPLYKTKHGTMTDDPRAQRVCGPCTVSPPTAEEEVVIHRSYRLSPGVKI
jgi:hypothetical protein